MVAQGKIYEEDVIYLKNGSMLRGEIIEHAIGDYVKIRLHEGVVFTYKTTEIEKITREAAKFSRIRLKYLSGLMPIRYQEKGKIYTQISYGLAMNETEYETLTNITVQIRSLYHVNRFINAGLGSGLDFYEGGLIVPVFAEIQGDFLRKRITPYYSLQGGYGLGTSGSSNHIVFDGGMMAHAALGIHWYTANRRSYFLSLGFKMQDTYQEFWEFTRDVGCCGFPGGQAPDPPLVIGTRRYQKIVLQFGYTF